MMKKRGKLFIIVVVGILVSGCVDLSQDQKDNLRRNTVSGCFRMRPLEESIRFCGGNLNFCFMNGAGQDITNAQIVSVSGDCSNQTVPYNLSIDGFMGDIETSPESLKCAGKADGESFGTTFTIIYTVTVSGTDINHTETGTIRGIVDCSIEDFDCNPNLYKKDEIRESIERLVRMVMSLVSDITLDKVIELKKLFTFL